MKYQGFIGPTYRSASRNADCERLVNYYPEIIESGLGKDGNLIYYRTTPGLQELFSVGTGPIRLIHAESINRSDDLIIGKDILFVVSGNEVYRCYYNGSWQTLLMGVIGTSSGPVSAASIKVVEGTGFLYSTVFVDGDTNYVYSGFSYQDLETFKSFLDLSLTQISNATQVLWLDGFLIMISRNSNEYHISEWQGDTFDPLDFATAEGSPDVIVGMITLHRDLWLLNERTTEIETNTGAADFPFERVGGGFSEKGCLAGFSVAKTDSTVFWLGRDESGQGVIYAAQGIVPQRVSNHAVEQAIASYANNANAMAYCYQSQGHSFYVLNFDEATWVYDLQSKMWHERAFLENGILTRHRANSHCFFPSLNYQIVGDYQSGKVYQMSDSVYSDNGSPIYRMRIAPHISNSLKRVVHHSFQIDMECEALATGQGSDPQMMMQFSDDGAHSWSNEKWVSMGKVGNAKARAIYRRLGQSRDRVYKTVVTDPIPHSLIGAELEMSGE